MSSKGPGQLCFINGTVNAQKYQNILEEHLIPSIQQFGSMNELIFQQDGASCHTAKSTKKWLDDNGNGMTVMDWPSSSPDLNPIENLWGNIKRKLRINRPKTVQELKNKIELIWSQISTEECANLYNSMGKRMRCVIKAKGDVTQF